MKRAHFLAGGLALLSGAALVGSAVWFSTGGGSEEASTSDLSSSTATTPASPSASATAPASLGPTVTASQPVPLPADIGSLRAIYLTQPDFSYWTPKGEVWIAKLDGTESKRLTNDNEVASFAGIAPYPATGERAVYLVTVDGPQANVWAVSLSDFDRTRLLTFESRREGQAEAAISPDGRYLAYVDLSGLEILDLSIGGQRRLLDNGPRDCDARSCLGHGAPQWSPDGRLLSVQRGYWEGGTTVVIDPFATPVVPHTNDSPLGPTAARWSTDSATMCGYGTYGGLTSLSTAHEPEWLFSDAIADFTTYDAGPPQVERNVTECAWLDPNRVAFLANIARYDRGPVPRRSVELFLFDVKSGELDPITEFTGGVQVSAAAVLALPNAALLAQQLIDQEGNGGFQPAQPQIVDVSTGAQTPVLAAGQRVVAILSP